MRIWTQALMAIFLVSAAGAKSPARLWVLQEPDKIVEYDLASFAAGRAIPLPRGALEHPEFMSVNGRGQILFHPPQGTEGAAGEMASAGKRVWLWDGRREREWNPPGGRTRGRTNADPVQTETKSRCFLSGDGESLVWIENTFEKRVDEAGAERSVRSSARVWRTDVGNRRPEAMARVSSFGWCECATGVCSETCPEWELWAPQGVVAGFFLLTRITPGQLGSTWHESLLYRGSKAGWRKTILARPIEKALDASDQGETLAAAALDGGCCGWENEGSDQLLLLRKGSVAVLYDEFGRFGNMDYDVSFYPADARLSPGGGMLAYTLASTAAAAGEIRLSSSGKENIEERVRVRKAIGESPAVEVVQLGERPAPVTLLRRASLVGWLSERELLIAREGRLIIFDLRKAKEKETRIRVRSAADAFLR